MLIFGKTMSRTIIMIDHGGVIDESTRLAEEHIPEYKATLLQYYSEDETKKAIQEKKLRSTDFILSVDKDNDISVMPNGEQTIKLLNRLVKEKNCILVFHSSNPRINQIDVMKGLKKAARAYMFT